MNDMAARKELLDASLLRAAEQLGDITAPVVELFYSRHPECRRAFETLWPGRQNGLEGEMVERVLYCLMQWFESPGEIEIMLMGSVPHHAMTLKVDPAWYGGFLEAAIDVLTATIPPDCAAERAVWADLRGELLQLIETSSQA